MNSTPLIWLRPYGLAYLTAKVRVGTDSTAVRLEPGHSPGRGHLVLMQGDNRKRQARLTGTTDLRTINPRVRTFCARPQRC